MLMSSLSRQTTTLGAAFVLVLLAGKFEHVLCDVEEICSTEDLNIECSGNEVIMMTSAEYGREKVGRCITKPDDFMGCTNDVLPLLDRWCSGREECEVEVPNADLDAFNTECLDILRSYLEVDYSCIPVQRVCSSATKNILSANDGIISSHVSAEKGCGGQRSPWVVSVSPGQMVNMSLVDFSVDPDGGQNLVQCRRVYGYILERALGINHTICGRATREAKLYESKTNNVEIVLLNLQNNKFLLKYNVLGCADLKPPVHAWYKRERDEAVIGCETNDQEWRLTCSRNTWHGTVGNCNMTDAEFLPVTRRPKERTQLDFPTILIFCAVAAGAVVVVVIVIVVGVVYVQKSRIKRETIDLQKTYATIDRTTLAYYRPVAAEPLTNQPPPPPPLWDAPLTEQEAGSMTSHPPPCSCGTLQSRGSHDLLGDGSFDKQGIYSSIKST